MEDTVKGGYPHRDGDKGFLRSVAGSLVAHLVFIAFALFIYKGHRRYLIPPVYTVNLIEPGGAKSAAVGAEEKPAPPVKTPEPPKKETVKETAAPRPAKAAPRAVKVSPPVKVTSKDTVALKAKLKSIKERVRAKEEDSLVESRIKQFKENEDTASVEHRVEELKKKGLSAGQVMAGGNEGHGRGAEQGPGGGISKGNVESRYKAYYSSIRDRVQEAWIYPEGFENRKVTIIVSVKIAKSGQLLESWVNESSGNPRFDESLIDAIKKASPFPPLPADFEGAYLETGFRFCHPPCG